MDPSPARSASSDNSSSNKQSAERQGKKKGVNNKDSVCEETVEKELEGEPRGGDVVDEGWETVTRGRVKGSSQCRKLSESRSASNSSSNGINGSNVEVASTVPDEETGNRKTDRTASASSEDRGRQLRESEGRKGEAGDQPGLGVGESQVEEEEDSQVVSGREPCEASNSGSGEGGTTEESGEAAAKEKEEVGGCVTGDAGQGRNESEDPDRASLPGEEGQGDENAKVDTAAAEAVTKESKEDEADVGRVESNGDGEERDSERLRPDGEDTEDAGNIMVDRMETDVGSSEKDVDEIERRRDEVGKIDGDIQEASTSEVDPDGDNIVEALRLEELETQLDKEVTSYKPASVILLTDTIIHRYVYIT